MTRSPVLSVEGMHIRREAADRSFTLHVEELTLFAGEVAALTGPSGSGKSTLLEVVGLAARPDEIGGFRLSGKGGALQLTEDVRRGARARLAAVRAARIGFVLQTGGLLPFLTLRENIELPQRFAGNENADFVEALLSELGLAPFSAALPGALSVGQRQRAAVARAVAHRPDIILADEPTAALDPENKKRVANLLQTLAGAMGVAVLVASHEREIFGGEGVRQLSLRLDGGEGDAMLATLEAAA